MNRLIEVLEYWRDFVRAGGSWSELKELMPEDIDLALNEVKKNNDLLEALKWSFDAMSQDVNLNNGDSMFKKNLREIKQLIEKYEQKEV